MKYFPVITECWPTYTKPARKLGGRDRMWYTDDKDRLYRGPIYPVVFGKPHIVEAEKDPLVEYIQIIKFISVIGK